MDYQSQRKRLIEWTKSQLIGKEFKDAASFGDKSVISSFKDATLVGEKPLDRIFTGFLFPIFEDDGDAELDFGADEDIAVDLDDETEAKSVKKVKRYIPPSSAGFSFFITGENIKLRVFYKAVWYKKVSNRDELNQKFAAQRWEKNQLADHGNEVEFSPRGVTQHMIFDGKAKIDALWRKYNDGYIVTISISNTQKLSLDDSPDQYSIKQNENTLFEVEFRCIIEEGDIDAYPSKDKQLLSEEEREIELRYKDLHIYAIGHGTAVDWGKNLQHQMEIWSDFMPTVEVPQVTADTGEKNSEVLTFSFLSKCENSDQVIVKLKQFVSDYELWIGHQKSKAKTEDDDDQKTAENIVNHMVIAKQRMERGISLLEQDQLAKTSFAIANKAMLLQMMSTDQAKGKKVDSGQYKWRPFQLAFVLMVLESATNEDSEFRDTLDLIWFPTGGGKTEAYLGLMAFLFIYRRLKYPASYGGTVAIMRYTLRLLTSQQFLRASKVISALELIRREDVKKLGTEAITVGLWVGAASSPNTYFQAKGYVDEQKYSKLILNSCPWCGAEFTKDNYVAKEDDFYFTCTNRNCDFGKEENNVLPCNVVDEALYKKPTSLLIATVDKFARLAWEQRAGSFFGKEGCRPPELIIQDELHLISSALGSIVGLYEVGIDTVLVSRGIRAKFVASTATIKNAKKQIQTLFAKEMLIFPPPGLRYEDSYFAKTVSLDEKPGRLYVGYLAPILNRQRCLEPLAGVLLSAPAKLFKDQEEYLDAWWTQVIYHGSLKSVGNSRTLYQSGASAYLHKYTLENLKNEIERFEPNFFRDKRIKTISDYQKIEIPEVKSIVDKYLPVRGLNVKTLTSNQSAEENAFIFDALAKECYENDSIDVALATNMISVGLDVSRLALMVINGQPLTTAEYIQASSRVGRGDIPGIVFINYYKTQARSLSHYENFRSYHDSFYRFVEPSSLTPFTYQARSRALHAALVIAMRFSNIGLRENSRAEYFNPEDSDTKRVIKEMKNRISLAMHDKAKIGEVHDHIDDLIASWKNEVEYCEKRKRNLVYYSKDKGSDNLIHNFDERQGLWATLQSMRNVENVALLKSLKSVRLKDEP